MVQIFLYLSLPFYFNLSHSITPSLFFSLSFSLSLPLPLHLSLSQTHKVWFLKEKQLPFNNNSLCLFRDKFIDRTYGGKLKETRLLHFSFFFFTISFRFLIELKDGAKESDVTSSSPEIAQ